MLHRIVLPCLPSMVHITREIITDRINDTGHASPDTLATAQLLTSELVTNSVLHSHAGFHGSEFTLELTVTPGHLALTVFDGGPAPHGSRPWLHLIDTLATHWEHHAGPNSDDNAWIVTLTWDTHNSREKPKT